MAILNFPSIVPSTISFGIKYSTQINISPLSGAVQTIEIPGARWVADMSFSEMEAEENRVLAAFLAELRGSAGRFYLYDFSHAQSEIGSNLAAGTVTVDVKNQATIDSGTALGTHSTTTMQDTTAAFITDGDISVNDYIYNADTAQLRQIQSFTETEITVNSAWTTPLNADVYEIYPLLVGNSIPTVGWNTNETGLLLPGDYIELEGKELKVVTSSVDSNGSGEATITFEPPIRAAPGDATTVIRANCEASMLLSEDESRWNVDNSGLLSTINISCMEGF